MEIGGNTMKLFTHKTAITAAMLITMAPAQAAYSGSVYERWQLQRLLQPSDTQLKQEQKGKIFIYEGIKDKDISRVMGEQFDRVETMMFIGTVVTDEYGQPQTDPETGLAMIEDDGC